MAARGAPRRDMAEGDTGARFRGCPRELAE